MILIQILCKLFSILVFKEVFNWILLWISNILKPRNVVFNSSYNAILLRRRKVKFIFISDASIKLMLNPFNCSFNALLVFLKFALFFKSQKAPISILRLVNYVIDFVSLNHYSSKGIEFDFIFKQLIVWTFLTIESTLSVIRSHILQDFLLHQETIVIYNNFSCGLV